MDKSCWTKAQVTDDSKSSVTRADSCIHRVVAKCVALFETG